jgi:hypothetical protein
MLIGSRTAQANGSIALDEVMKQLKDKGALMSEIKAE